MRTIAKPHEITPAARALVPFFVEHIAAFRAMTCAHINAVRQNGGQARHVAKTRPRYSRARSALIRAMGNHDHDAADKVLALEVAEQILRSESEARHAGQTWDADSSVAEWQDSWIRVGVGA